jgi:uncharacterized radical SAM superfamily protein
MDQYSGASAHTVPQFTMPYGIVSMVSYIRTHCAFPVECDLLDFNVVLKTVLEENNTTEWLRIFHDAISERLRTFRPTLVGISALFNISFKYIELCARACKDQLSDVPVVAGGGLPSAAFREVLSRCPSVDAVCKGEGEIPLADLLNADDMKGALESHVSWVSGAAASSGKIPEHTFVQDLDDIPLLDYSIINLDHYNSRSLDKRRIGVKKREMAIHTSRGCPFHCIFCSNPSLHGHKVRAMSVARVCETILLMKEKYGLTVLLIEDDHFFFDKNRAKEILRRVAKLNIRVEFPNGVAVYAIDAEIAELFKAAGVSAVALAVESGSDYVLNKIIRKPLRVSAVREKVRVLRDAGVQVHAFIVIGLPGEMPEHRRETLQMLLEAGFDWAHIFCAVPILGSRLHEICVINGYIDEKDFADHVVAKSVIHAPGVDPDDIERTAYYFNLSVNFVHNYNMKIENYQTAVDYFANVANKYPNHAFGHYFLAKALEGCGRFDEADKSRKKYRQAIEADPWWHEHAVAHGLESRREAVLQAARKG